MWRVGGSREQRGGNEGMRRGTHQLCCCGQKRLFCVLSCPLCEGAFLLSQSATCAPTITPSAHHSPASVFGLPLGSLPCLLVEECGFAEARPVAASCSLPLAAPASFPLHSGSSESESESESSSSAFSLAGAVPIGSFFLGSAEGELAVEEVAGGELDFAGAADIFGSGRSGVSVGMPKWKVRVGRMTRRCNEWSLLGAVGAIGDVIK